MCGLSNCYVRLVHVLFVRYFGTLFWDEIRIYWDEKGISNLKSLKHSDGGILQFLVKIYPLLFRDLGRPDIRENALPYTKCTLDERGMDWKQHGGKKDLY